MTENVKHSKINWVLCLIKFAERQQNLEGEVPSIGDTCKYFPVLLSVVLFFSL